MKKLVSVKVAGNILLISLGIMVIFHVLVLLNIVPSDIVWGGQIGDSQTNLLTLEIIALLMTMVILVIIAAKMNYINVIKFKRGINFGVWLIFVFLILNTVLNLASGVSFENLIFRGQV